MNHYCAGGSNIFYSHIFAIKTIIPRCRAWFPEMNVKGIKIKKIFWRRKNTRGKYESINIFQGNNRAVSGLRKAVERVRQQTIIRKG